jgi:F-type H+-transporting ATPase subunit beta
VAQGVKRILQRYKDLQDIIAILGIDELERRRQDHRGPRPQGAEVPLAALPRRRAVHRHPGPLRARSPTRCAPSRKIIEGKHDDVPEQAFYMKGTIEEVLETAEKMKATA